jgi:hypothetical protein
VNNTGGGTGGTSPEVVAYATASFGSASVVPIGTWPIFNSASTPFYYSLSSTPVLAQAAVSPDGDSLLLTDSANSAVLTMDVGRYDTSTIGKIVGEASLNGSTSVSPKGISFLPDGSFAYVFVTADVGFR